MRSKSFKILIAIILTGALMVGAFFIFFEKVEVTIQTDASNAAKKNPFLAAEHFLIASGYQAKSINKKERLINLPPTEDMIFINKLGGNLPSEREDELIEWIQKGGSLIITHNKFWNEISQKSGNAFLDRLNIRLRSSYDFVPDEDNEGEDIRDETPNQIETDKKHPLGMETVVVSFPGDEPAEIEIGAGKILEIDENASALIFSGDKGPHVVIQEIGEGRLIVLSDNDFLQNTNIEKFDHAWFLALTAKNRAKVWILYDSLMPSFISILFDKAFYFIISLFILVLFSLLRLNMMIGPTHRIQDNSSRNIIENLQASGNFLLRNKKKTMLIYQSRASIEKHLAKKHLFLDRKEQHQKFELISKWTSIPEEQVKFAFLNEAGSAEEFIKITALLKKIHFDLLINNKKTENI